MTTKTYLSATAPVASDAQDVVLALAAATTADTYFVYETPSTWTFAAGALAEVVVTSSHAVLRQGGTERTVPREPRALAELPGLLAELGPAGWRAHGVAHFELAYDLAGIGSDAPAAPLLHLVVPETEVRIRDGVAEVRAVDQSALEQVLDMVAAPVEPLHPKPEEVPVDPQGALDYHRAVYGAVRQIRGGRLQKVVLSRTVPVSGQMDLVATYAAGRARNAPARSFLVSLDGLGATGFSPEMVVEVGADGRVSTQPLAGTRALLAGADEHNERLRAELVSDPKEVFEHAISVRAAQTELASVCEPGSVVVDDFMDVKHRGTVQHLGSTVSGRLRAGFGPWDAFATVFPSITVVGVPKAAAYEWIREYEDSPRGLYGGAVLQVDADGSIDAALVLRTAFQRDGRSWLRAGAGIVAQSDPAREFEETCEKLRSVALNVVRSAPAQPEPQVTPLTREQLLGDVAALLHRPADELDVRSNLIEQGLDSVAVMTLASKWRRHGVVVELIDLAERPTIGDWWELLSANGR